MRITKRSLDALNNPDKVTFFWDDSLKGFGIKVYPSGRISFVLQGRVNGRLRRYTIGRYGAPWSPDQAREQALSFLSLMTQGIDPTEEKRAKRLEGSVSELIGQYLDEVASRKKPSTQEIERSVLERHVIPLIGNRRISEITKRDVGKLMTDIAKGKTAKDIKTGPRGRAIVKGGPGAANRTIAVLSTLMGYAIDLGLRTDNPTIGIKKFRLKSHDRYLNSEELDRLGNALDKVVREGANPFAIAAIRFLALTGCRKSEALTLQWNWIDWDHSLANLPDSKTNHKPLLLGNSAISLLKSLPKLEDSPLVFPSAKGGLVPISISKVWNRVRNEADLTDLRLHDLRHNFASTAVSSGQSLYVVGKLLGHTQSQTTQRYSHLAPDPMRDAADMVSKDLAGKLGLDTAEKSSNRADMSQK